MTATVSSAAASAATSTSPDIPALRVLEGQTALVTGANSGIGRAVAIGLGKAGANVVVNYVDAEETAAAVVEEIRRGGGGSPPARPRRRSRYAPTCRRNARSTACSTPRWRISARSTSW
jgi:hypothetical protein